jgi:CrcB protein
MIWFVIAAGGGLGAIARHYLATVVTTRVATWTPFPAGTMTVNVIGCLLAGLVIGATTRAPLSVEARTFLTVGVLGGFTTFSAFGADTFVLVQSGAASTAVAYVLASVTISLAAVWVGFAIAS